MRRLTGHLAAEPIVSANYVPPGALRQVNALVDEGALAADRPPTPFRRASNLMGTIAERGDAIEGSAVVEVGGAHDVATQVAAMTRYAAEGRIDGFVFWPAGDDSYGQFRRFAAGVIPAVRAAVEERQENPPA